MRQVIVTTCCHFSFSIVFSIPVCRYPISGVALITVSPSSTSSSRNTPCVDGCCGPIDIVICVSASGSVFRSIEIADVGTTISLACISSVRSPVSIFVY